MPTYLPAPDPVPKRITEVDFTRAGVGFILAATGAPQRALVFLPLLGRTAMFQAFNAPNWQKHAFILRFVHNQAKRNSARRSGRCFPCAIGDLLVDVHAGRCDVGGLGLEMRRLRRPPPPPAGKVDFRWICADLGWICGRPGLEQVAQRASFIARSHRVRLRAPCRIWSWWTCWKYRCSQAIS